MDSLLYLLVIGGLFPVILLYHLWTAKSKSNNKNKEAPQPAGAWPLIGHLHLLDGSKPLAQTLAAIADKYGPVFILRLGVHRTLFVSDWEVAKECFTTNDKVLATRPHSAAGKYLGYDFAMVGFAPYGPYWREIRKIATLEILSNRRLESLKHVRATEIDTSIKELYGIWVKNSSRTVQVEMKQWFSNLTFNSVVMMVAGKRYFGNTSACDEGDARSFQKAMNELLYLTGVFVISDALPFLRGVDLQGHERAMKRTASKLDSILVKWVEEHRQKRRAGDAEGEKDFIDVMLSIMEDAQLSSYDHDTIIKATSLAMIIGGTDTTTVSLTWTLSLIMNNPHVLKRAQDELDVHVGKERNVEESDIQNLVYLQAIVKETMRLYPAAPLSVPHEATGDCHIGGFHVTKGTRVFVNLWKLQRDPRVWSDPCEFHPERFLTTHADIDVRGQHFELLPFGSGRRSCPGISFALQVLHLTLARLLHGFYLATPSGAPVDMTVGLGLTNPRASPLEVLFTPRLPTKLYQ